MQALRHFLLAVQFFSRIPVTGGWRPGWAGALTCSAPAPAHLPGVGWLVGLSAAPWLLACTWRLAHGSPCAAAGGCRHQHGGHAVR